MRLVFGLNAFVHHFAARFLLWLTGCLPWNLVAFLDEAAERLLLHKVGGNSIFIHRLLLESLALQNVSHQSAASGDNG
jgi:hypothetical protein